MESFTDYEKWVMDCERAGLCPISDDTCYKLMAWLLSDGGQVEVNYNTKLMADIKYAQKHLHIDGGETPDAKAVKEIKRYLHLIETGNKSWVETLLSRYGIGGLKK